MPHEIPLMGQVIDPETQIEAVVDVVDVFGVEASIDDHRPIRSPGTPVSGSDGRWTLQVLSGRRHGELAVLDALRSDQPVGDFFDVPALSLDDEDFQAMVCVEMDVEG